MPPRKTADVWEASIDDTPAPVLEPIPAQPEPGPPGPIRLEVRIDDRIHFLQRVYSYTIDQTNPNQAVITGHLTPADTHND